MNKTILIAGAAGVVGFIAGALAGYFYHRHIMFKKYVIVEEEIVPLEYETEPPKEEPKKETEEKEEEEKDPFANLDIPEIRAKDEGNGYKRAFVDYAKICETRTDIHPTEEDVQEYQEPYVITLDEFSSGRRHYDKTTVEYYSDGVFVEQGNEEPDAEIGRYMGNIDIPHSFGIGSEDSDVVYVRNERFSTDFEVIRKKERYFGGDSN